MHQPKSNTSSADSAIKRKSFFGFQKGPLQESVFFQPKLQVGPVNDVYEREADAVADRVVRMSHDENSMRQISAVSVQRKCAKCQEEDEVQRKEEHDDGHEEATPIVESTIGASGKPIEEHTRSFMENRFGYDFSNVKIHNNSQAVQSAQSINALAYTSGTNIVFNEGQYAPGTESGKRLLAHELTHVVQQRGAQLSVQRQVVPNFRDCTPHITGRADSNQVLNRARLRAIDYVNAAIGVLVNAPVPGTTYAVALPLHFGLNLSDAHRQRILLLYRRILPNLVASNFMCNRNACVDRRTQAQWAPDDDLIHICVPFWGLPDENCQAIVIIHEAAHDAGIDINDPSTQVEELHTPNRGDANYPVSGGVGVGRVSRSLRMNTPDAYGFFAAHIFNNTDTPGNCS
jgi:hypothetical protein